MAGNLDSYQLLTLIFGGTIILATLLEYNNTDYNENFKALMRVAEGVLAVFFAAYALISSSARGREASMYKNLILVLGIGALIIVVAQKTTAADCQAQLASPAGGWDQVNALVTYRLAQGALFALPVAFLGFRG